ncbi:hypothetical protein [Streptomyces sp. NPDC005141]
MTQVGSPSCHAENGAPALALSADGIEQVVTVSVHEGRVDGVFAVLDPDKPGHMGL